jgi:hypothetical protein
VLLIQDVHIIIGREELPFDDAYQNVFAPRVAEDAGTRLAAFFWAPHGAGEGYEAVTLTAVADADALARHQERLATGDLADCWLELEAKHRQLQSSLHVVAEWSPFAARGLDAFTIAEHPTALFRLDSFTVDGPVVDAVAAVESQCRSASDDATVSIIGCWSPFLGDLDEPIVSVLSRVASDEALRAAFAEPTQPWTGVPELPGARRLTRVLRSVSWSPVA